MVAHAWTLTEAKHTQHVPLADYQHTTNLGSFAYYAQAIHNHSIRYSRIETTALVTLVGCCTIIALFMLHLALLAFVYLAVSLALMATKATFRAKEAVTIAFLIT